MRKWIVLGIMFVVGLIWALNAAASSRVPLQDLNDNGREYTEYVCPSGTKLTGFAYFDLRNDSADAASVICEYPSGEEYIPKDQDWPSSGLREIQRHKCDLKTETIYGIRYKDRDVSGAHRDAMDGFVVGCKNKKSGDIRWSYSDDLIGGREWTTLTNGGKKVIGIAYKDGGCGGIKTDCADGVTFVFK